MLSMLPLRPLSRRGIATHLLTVCTAMMLLGCGATGPDADARSCPQTYEFGNTGCLEVIGQVVGLRGQQLAGITVRPGYLPDRGGFNIPIATTDGAGTFSFRVSRMAGNPPAAGPDTLSLWVVGADPASAGVNIPARVRDSVLVQATVSPVGTVPTPATVRLTLQAP